MTERDELVGSIRGLVEAWTGYHPEDGKVSWYVDTGGKKRAANIDGMIDEIIALVRQDERKRIREDLLADDYGETEIEIVEAEGDILSTTYNRFIAALLDDIGITEELT